MENPQTTTDIWTYRETESMTPGAMNLEGFSVEATDGGIGKVDEATYQVSQSYIVVDTGPWIFGKKVMLPAGVIDRVDLDAETVYVSRTKDEIKNAPEFDEARYRDEEYRTELGGYYGSGRTL
ncbi:MAG TPA: PRC-barrel domain-containing protein [Gaiellaceae bacterium]|nr:PRC-barrel domain-containing protein [Gaiellaceae bacterium]